MPVYIGINNVIRTSQTPALGVNGVVRNMKDGYVGVNGTVRSLSSNSVADINRFELRATGVNIYRIKSVSGNTENITVIGAGMSTLNSGYGGLEIFEDRSIPCMIRLTAYASMVRLQVCYEFRAIYNDGTSDTFYNVPGIASVTASLGLQAYVRFYRTTGQYRHYAFGRELVTGTVSEDTLANITITDLSTISSCYMEISSHDGAQSEASISLSDKGMTINGRYIPGKVVNNC